MGSREVLSFGWQVKIFSVWNGYSVCVIFFFAIWERFMVTDSDHLNTACVTQVARGMEYLASLKVNKKYLLYLLVKR